MVVQPTPFFLNMHLEAVELYLSLSLDIGGSVMMV